MFESCHWKCELARIAKSIRPSNKPARWSERLHDVTARELMVGFFLVRRLIEMTKVSSAVYAMPMSIFSCPRLGKNVHRLNCHCIDELYDLNTERKQTKKPLYVSNQFIHAYTWVVARDEKRNWSSIYIVSDYDRNDCIWRIPVAEIRRLFETASLDYPNLLSSRFVNGDYEYATN